MDNGMFITIQSINTHSMLWLRSLKYRLKDAKVFFPNLGIQNLIDFHVKKITRFGLRLKGARYSKQIMTEKLLYQTSWLQQSNAKL